MPLYFLQKLLSKFKVQNAPIPTDILYQFLHQETQNAEIVVDKLPRTIIKYSKPSGFR